MMGWTLKIANLMRELNSLKGKDNLDNRFEDEELKFR